mmetsp:Transcript_10686/g.28799  ORF Transcript_10686/g.28799 Transcript_10686/m.28799 type:complete len:223 (+) Transcript_10686:17-685(+)
MSFADVWVSMFKAALAMLVCGWLEVLFLTENLPSRALTLTMCPKGSSSTAGANTEARRLIMIKGAAVFAANVCSNSMVETSPRRRDQLLEADKSSGCRDSSTNPSGKSLSCSTASFHLASSLAVPSCTHSTGMGAGRPWVRVLSSPMCTRGRNNAFARGGRAAAASDSNCAIRSCQPIGRERVCAALLINTWMRGNRRRSSSQKPSTSLKSQSSTGPHTSSR